ncbi:MAG: hypothetical protein ACSLEW_02055 [Nocardioides sp.]
MNQSGHGDSGHDPVGSAAEEAAKLFGALADWAKERGPELGAGLSGMAQHAASGFATTFNEHIDTGAPECDWCPICRTVHVVRQASPEVRDHLVTAATSLLHATLALIGSSNSAADPSRRQARVQNIDLSDTEDWPSS